MTNQNINFDSTTLNDLCNVLGQLLTNKEIDKNLAFSEIEDVCEDPVSVTPYAFTINYSIANRLHNCFVNVIQKENNTIKIERFIENVMNPASYNLSLENFENNRSKLNSVLIFLGREINQDGKVVICKQCDNIPEAKRRLLSLETMLESRKMHHEIFKYCKEEFLVEDYYHCCFEAIKGVYSRIRVLTNILDKDGSELLDIVFSKNKPLLVINNMSNQTEKDEFRGLKELILSVHYLIKNKVSHTTRYNNEIEFYFCLDILAIVSRIHYYLDEAQQTCFTGENFQK